ncbi:hypothetical protein NBRC111452_735 [Companilactobacillus farciminis]|jgi:hypothetical protein|nr:hypothetical protein NBRC111452_735 [Companilactobacillus farciminis]
MDLIFDSLRVIFIIVSNQKNCFIVFQITIDKSYGLYMKSNREMIYLFDNNLVV